MSRFFIPPTAIRGRQFILSGSEAHHAIHVLRKKQGDAIDLFDGKDQSFTGTIDHIANGKIHGHFVEDLASARLPVQVILYQALSRGPKWEWLLEKACEVGVSGVVPVISQRTLIKLDDGDTRKKTERWSRIAMAAAKQSGRGELMHVREPLAFMEAITRIPKGELGLIPSEKESVRSIRDAFGSYQGKAAHVFIGPEGGWHSSEVDAAVKAGIVPVRLGPTLLRTETAGVVAATLVLREFGVY